jgi:hypothetical protein
VKSQLLIICKIFATPAQTPCVLDRPESRGNLASYSFPDAEDPAFYEGMEERSRSLDRDKYIKTGIFMVLFERFHSLRGFENLMLDFYLEREKFEALADRIVEFDIGIIRNTARRFPGLIDGIGFSGDWGTGQAAFISVELFDEFFKPRGRVLQTPGQKDLSAVWGGRGRGLRRFRLRRFPGRRRYRPGQTGHV